MSDDKFLENWKTYQAAWADIAHDERRALLEHSVASDCAYADPAGTADGIEELVVYIGKFQQQFRTPTSRTTSSRPIPYNAGISLVMGTWSHHRHLNALAKETNTNE